MPKDKHKPSRELPLPPIELKPVSLRQSKFLLSLIDKKIDYKNKKNFREWSVTDLGLIYLNQIMQIIDSEPNLTAGNFDVIIQGRLQNITLISAIYDYIEASSPIEPPVKSSKNLLAKKSSSPNPKRFQALTIAAMKLTEELCEARNSATVPYQSEQQSTTSEDDHILDQRRSREEADLSNNNHYAIYSEMPLGDIQFNSLEWAAMAKKVFKQTNLLERSSPEQSKLIDGFYIDLSNIAHHKLMTLDAVEESSIGIDTKTNPFEHFDEYEKQVISNRVSQFFDNLRSQGLAQAAVVFEVYFKMMRKALEQTHLDPRAFSVAAIGPSLGDALGLTAKVLPSAEGRSNKREMQFFQMLSAIILQKEFIPMPNAQPLDFLNLRVTAAWHYLQLNFKVLNNSVFLPLTQAAVQNTAITNIPVDEDARELLLSSVLCFLGHIRRLGYEEYVANICQFLQQANTTLAQGGDFHIEDFWRVHAASLIELLNLNNSHLNAFATDTDNECAYQLSEQLLYVTLAQVLVELASHYKSFKNFEAKLNKNYWDENKLQEIEVQLVKLTQKGLGTSSSPTSSPVSIKKLFHPPSESPKEEHTSKSPKSFHITSPFRRKRKTGRLSRDNESTIEELRDQVEKLSDKIERISIQQSDRSADRAIGKYTSSPDLTENPPITPAKLRQAQLGQWSSAFEVDETQQPINSPQRRRRKAPE